MASQTLAEGEAVGLSGAGRLRKARKMTMAARNRAKVRPIGMQCP